MTIRAALFDIDGTLVDSNYLRVDAWSPAFADVGQPVDAWKIHRRIGMDGEKLLDELLENANSDTRRDAQELHARQHESNAGRLRVFSGARELAMRNIAVVLATSARAKHLERLRSVLSIDDAVDVITSSEDVDTAKPSPDLVRVAIERSKVRANEAVMIGDSVWDMEAAARAGVASIGVLSGGSFADELRTAGATEVHSSVEELLAHLDDSILGSAN